MLLDTVQERLNVLLRMLDLLDTHNTSKNQVGRRVGARGRDDTGTVNQIDALHQTDILPDLSLSRNGSNSANLLFEKGVDDGRLSSVRPTNQTDRYLFSVGV
jgi:hypothetical protein